MTMRHAAVYFQQFMLKAELSAMSSSGRRCVHCAQLSLSVHDVLLLCEQRFEGFVNKHAVTMKPILFPLRHTIHVII